MNQIMKEISESLKNDIDNKSMGSIHSTVCALNSFFGKKSLIWINKESAAFMKYDCYGIGIVNGKYRIEIQEPEVPGDRGGNWFFTCESDNIEKIVKFIKKYDPPKPYFYK